MPSKQAQVAVERTGIPDIVQEALKTLPKEVQKQIKLLYGFRDLAGERWGYFLGRRMTQANMNDQTKEERKKVREVRKEITDNLEEYIRTSDLDTYVAKVKALKDAREVVSKKSKPFREKISPIAKAQKYLDTVAIPDALKELGTPVQPRFSLSKWITKAMKSEK